MGKPGATATSSGEGSVELTGVMSKRGFDGATVDRGGSIGTGGGFEEAPGGGEKLALPVVRGLPLLLLPHHVEIIWQAHDIETATARAATGAHLREGSQKTGASVATAATLAEREASYSGVAASADAKTGQNPTDSAPGQKHTIGLHGATGQVQRSTAGGSTSGKKSSVNSSHTRDSVAKGGKDGCSASGGSKLQGSTPAGGVAGPAGVCRNGKLRPGSLVTTQNSEADRAMVRDAGIRSCVEETCRILRLGPEGRRKQAVVDFHLFSLLFAREARLCSAKAAIFVSIMGVTLSQIETVAKAKNNSIRPSEVLKSVQELFKTHTFAPLVAARQSSALYGAAPSADQGSFPFFCQQEAKTLMKFAVQTVVAHCRLYLYCLKYEQSEISHVHKLYTFLPIWPPKCPVPLPQPSPASLEAIDSSAEGTGAVSEVAGAHPTDRKDSKSKHWMLAAAKN